MFCKKCGKQISNDSVFCEYCGTKVDEIAVQNVNDPSPKRIEYDRSNTSLSDDPIYNNIPSVRNERTSSKNRTGLIAGISLTAVVLIIGVVVYITHSSDKNNNYVSNDTVENVQDNESETAIVEDNNYTDDPAQQTTEQYEESADAVPEEDVRSVQMGDVVIVNQKSKCDGANQYDWRDDGRKIIVISDTDYAFVNEDFITPEEINNNVNQAIGKTVGDEFTLIAVGGDGDYTFTYTILDILDIEINDGYKQIMKNYLDIYNRVNSSEELDFDWLGNFEYNPEFLAGAGTDSAIPVFCVEDVNGDGIQELFIAMEDKDYYKNGTSEYDWTDTVYAGYTMSNGEPVLFTLLMIGYNAATCENGVFRNHGHVSGNEYYEAWEYLPPNGTELEAIENIYYCKDFVDENNVTITHSVGEETTEITEEERDSIFAKYPTRVLPYLSLEDYFGELYYR